MTAREGTGGCEYASPLRVEAAAGTRLRTGPAAVAATARPAVLVVAYAFPPASPIGTMRTLRLVRRLDMDGRRVTVLTVTARTYPAAMPNDHDLQRRVPASVQVMRAPVLRPLERVSAFLRGRAGAPQSVGTGATAAVPANGRSKLPKRLFTLLDEWTSIPDREVGWVLPACAAGLLHHLRHDADVLYSSAPPWSAQVAALALAQATGLPWVADFRDPWARAPWRETRPEHLRRAALALERRVVTRADAVLFATATNRDEYAAHYGPTLARKFHVVVNGCDPEEFAALPRPQASDSFVILHAGSLYGARNPVPLFRAVASAIRTRDIEPTRIRLRFAGASSAEAGFAAAAAAHGLGDIVEFVPRMQRARIIDEMTAASCFLVLQPGTTVSIPGKLYEYLAVGRPVLALCEEGETSDLVTASGIGIAVRPNDEAGIEAALRQLVAGRFQDAPRVSAHLYDGNLAAARAAAIIDATWRARQPSLAST